MLDPIITRRAREVLERIDGHGFMTQAEFEQAHFTGAQAVSAMLSFADEGSGMGVPEGFALVPIEPTHAMIEAASDHDNYWGYYADGRPSGPRDCWLAMLAASPDIDRSGLAQEVE